jgi:hypothetical protein
MGGPLTIYRDIKIEEPKVPHLVNICFLEKLIEDLKV